MFIEKEEEISIEDSFSRIIKAHDSYVMGLSNPEYLKRLRPYVITTKDKNSWLEIMLANIND